MQMIYKILTPQSWADMRADGQLTPTGVDAADGYVHFSTAAQLGETLNKHYAGYGDLVVLAVGAEALGVALKWEVSRGGDRFPHLYDTLLMDDVAADFAVNAARDGLDDWLRAFAGVAA
jgi:uncharacterized protein (DUF952 family)